VYLDKVKSTLLKQKSIIIFIRKACFSLKLIYGCAYSALSARYVDIALQLIVVSKSHGNLEAHGHFFLALSIPFLACNMAIGQK
jgi:hypothetical protein